MLHPRTVRLCRTRYTMELDETLRVITIVFVIALVLWGLGWLMQMYLWMRRNQRQQIDGTFLLKAVSQLCRVFSDVFFWYTLTLTTNPNPIPNLNPCPDPYLNHKPPTSTLIPTPTLTPTPTPTPTRYIFGGCGWMYMLFKNQDEVFVMMPPDSALNPFRAILCCAFGAKCLHVIDMVWSQARSAHSQPTTPCAQPAARWSGRGTTSSAQPALQPHVPSLQPHVHAPSPQPRPQPATPCIPGAPRRLLRRLGAAAGAAGGREAAQPSLGVALRLRGQRVGQAADEPRGVRRVQPALPALPAARHGPGALLVHLLPRLLWRYATTLTIALAIALTITRTVTHGHAREYTHEAPLHLLRSRSCTPPRSPTRSDLPASRPTRCCASRSPPSCCSSCHSASGSSAGRSGTASSRTACGRRALRTMLLCPRYTLYALYTRLVSSSAGRAT